MKAIYIRDHHYWFAQRFLYDYIKRHTDATLEMFGNDGLRSMGYECLESLWELTYLITKETDNLKVPFEGLELESKKIDDTRTLVIITLPKPQAMSESYYVGVYYNTSKSKANPDFRYFTCEYHHEDTSAICEVSGIGHSLYGIDKNISKEEFIEKIMKFIS